MLIQVDALGFSASWLWEGPRRPAARRKSWCTPEWCCQSGCGYIASGRTREICKFDNFIVAAAFSLWNKLLLRKCVRHVSISRLHMWGWGINNEHACNVSVWQTLGLNRSILRVERQCALNKHKAQDMEGKISVELHIHRKAVTDL